jgi:hypothetical protein
MVPPAITAQAAGAIYGKVARYGFSSFQMVQGGAQLASADGSSILTLLGTGWQFAEDLSRSAFAVAQDKLSVALTEYIAALPKGARFVGQSVEMAGLWENLGGPADAYVTGRFVKDQAPKLVEGLGDLEFQAAGIRLNLTRPAPETVPPGMVFAGPPVDVVDVRVEPFLSDKSKLWLQVNGIFPVPVDTVGAVTDRIAMVRKILWDDLADRLALDD